MVMRALVVESTEEVVVLIKVAGRAAAFVPAVVVAARRWQRQRWRLLSAGAAADMVGAGKRQRIVMS
jgi:hypothetical protein